MKIIVTGHTSGIGEALLDLFSINKYDVYGISRNSSPKLEFSRQIELDLSREKDINLAYEWAKK